MFVVFEGVDGTGKSTQLRLAAAWLGAQGFDVVTCRDPGSTQLGEGVRELLLHRAEWSIEADTETLLFLAARCQLVREIIRPALAQGRWVLCDRFQMSTLVYQGYAAHGDSEWLRRLGAFAAGGLHPDLVFVFDLEVDLALQRLGKPRDRMEGRGFEYLAAVREGFRLEAARGGDSVVLLDANRPIDTIAADVADHLQRRFAGQFAPRG